MFPKGFKAAAVASEMRYKGRLDLGLIVANPFEAAAGIFTRNACQAAPVIWSKNRVPRGRAILINAGQANAQTGAMGEEDCRLSAEAVSGHLGLKSSDILLASTGVIGSRINMEAMLKALPDLVASLSPEGFPDFAKAIMTTDTVPKAASGQARFPDGPPCRIWGAAKGAGMIAPDMATMLGVILTDASLAPELVHCALANSAERTFNRITVDGDTSTNDSLFLIASGACGRATIESGAEYDIFEAAILEVMRSLSRQLIMDAEGATRLVEIVVKGAHTREEAFKAARTVAESPLVKTAFYGCDANWGRILAALGRSGAHLDPYGVNIDLNDVPWVRLGQDNGKDKEATEVMKNREYRLTIDLGCGECSDYILTSDLSHDYVSINGSYRS